MTKAYRQRATALRDALRHVLDHKTDLTREGKINVVFGILKALVEDDDAAYKEGYEDGYDAARNDGPEQAP
jgi:metal-responsive CopG/Arc/MetJ family transcriptional regulator